MEARSGDMFVRPVRGEGWVTESSERVVAAVDGETGRPGSTPSPVVSHIEGGCVAAPVRKAWSVGLTVWGAV